MCEKSIFRRFRDFELNHDMGRLSCLTRLSFHFDTQGIKVHSIQKIKKTIVLYKNSNIQKFNLLPQINLHISHIVFFLICRLVLHFIQFPPTSFSEIWKSGCPRFWTPDDGTQLAPWSRWTSPSSTQRIASLCPAFADSAAPARRLIGLEKSFKKKRPHSWEGGRWWDQPVGWEFEPEGALTFGRMTTVSIEICVFMLTLNRRHSRKLGWGQVDLQRQRLLIWKTEAFNFKFWYTRGNPGKCFWVLKWFSTVSEEEPRKLVFATFVNSQNQDHFCAIILIR